jgi:hypothetical protein
MPRLTGLKLFTHDIRWIVSLFVEPPLVERSRHEECCRDRIDGLTITISTEVTYFYGKYEIVVRDRHNTFVSVQNLWAMTYLSLTIQERVGIKKAVAIAKRLIKKNKSLLEG